VACFVSLSLSASAQIIVTEVGGVTSGGTLPGSPSNYVIFNGTNYPTTGVTNVAGSATDLTSFSIIGGEVGNAGSTGTFSLIKPPGGSTAIQTGAILSPHTIAVGLEEGSSPTFNYNDFNVYVMFSNAPNLPEFDTSIGLDGRINGSELPPTNVSVTDNNSSLSLAYYLEFNVTGLGTAVAAQEALGSPGPTDLVLRVFGGTNDSHLGELGGVAFQSVVTVPEPSTYLMLVAGLALLAFTARRRNAALRA
jgi:hypothetical protein